MQNLLTGRMACGLAGWLTILKACCAAAAAPSSGPPRTLLHEMPFRQIDLSAAMHLPPGWTLRAEQPAGGNEDASSDRMPARICFDGPPPAGKAQGGCKDLVLDSDGIDGMRYPLQTIDDISIAPIPNGAGGTRSAVLVRASYSGGSIHGTHALLIWRYMPVTGFSLGPEIHSVGTGGEQRFFTTGPLAGLFVQTSPTWTTQKTMADQEHVRIEVARLIDVGSYSVLSVLSPETYPTPANDGPPPHLIETLTPWIVQIIHAAYPKGLP